MQPAAVLNVLVNAQTGKAESELRRFERRVKDTARATKKSGVDKTELGFEFDDRAFKAYDRAFEKVDRQRKRRVAFKTVLGADFDGKAFTAYNREAEKAFASTRNLSRETRNLGRSANRTKSAFDKLTPGLSFATRIPAYKIAAIGASVQAVIPPVVALTSALAPLTGLLAALPGLATAAAQGIGTIALGMKGIGDAVKAAMDSQKTAVKDAGASLTAHRAAAEGVRTAIRAVGDAERGLEDAQQSAKDAQEALSGARRDAARELVDMRLAVSGAALSEKEARLELTRAIQEQAQVWADETATALDARDAELAVQRARLGLRESTVESKRAQTDYNDAQRKGVKGSDQVVSAQRGIQDAHRGVLDAQQALIDATRQVRIAQRDQAEAASQAAGGVAKLQTAMEGLPPAGRNFARFIISLKPRLDSLRAAAAAGIFPDLTKGIKAATSNFGVFHDVIAQTSSAIGRLGEAAGRKLGSDAWGRDIQVQGERNVVTITRLGTATLSLADGFRHIMLAAGPLVSFLTSSAERFSAIFASWAKGARESGKLDAFFQRTIRTTKLVVGAFWDFGRALINVGKIADRVWGQDLLRGINNVAERFRDWTESVRGQRAIEGYFERWRKRWVDIGNAVKGVIGEYTRLRREGKSAADAFTHVFADTIAKVIPAVFNKLGQQTPQIVSGFVRGFLNADAWGKLLVGTWLIAKFGGVAAFATIGRKLGAALGLGIASGSAAAVKGSAATAAATAGGGMFAVQGARERAAGGAAAGAGAGAAAGRLRSGLTKLGPMVKNIGAGVLAFQLLSGIADGITREGVKGISARLQQGFSTASFGIIPQPKTISDKMNQALTDAIAGSKSLDEIIRPQKDKFQISLVDLVKGDTRENPFTETQKRLIEQARKLKHTVTNVLGTGIKLSPAMLGDKGLERRIRGIGTEINRMTSGSIVDLTQLRKSVGLNMIRIRELMETHPKLGREALVRNFRASVRATQDLRERGVINTRQFGKEIERLLRVHTGAGKEAAKKNLFAARNAIAEAMGGAVRVTDKGAGQIRKIFVQELKLYGLSSKEIGFRLEGREFSGKSGKDLVNKQRGGLLEYAKGAMVPGSGSGDRVPLHLAGRHVANVEPGEFVSVANRKATAALMNVNDRVPRFAEGGIVGLGHKLQKMGYEVGEHPAFGGVNPVHVPTSYHYKGQALDVNDDVAPFAPGGGEPGSLDRLYSMLKGKSGIVELLWRVAGHFDHLHLAMGAGGGAGGILGSIQKSAAKIAKVSVGGPDSALKDVAQGALNKIRKAAQAKLTDAVAAAEMAGGSGIPGVGAPAGNYKGPLNRDFGANSGATISFNQAAMLAEKAGLPGVTYAQIAIGESGLRPGAVSPDGGYGLWQMTPRVQSPQTVAAWEKIGSYFNPWNNARQAKYLAGSGTGTSNYFGTGSVTDWNAHYTGPMKGLAKGGMVGYAGDSLGVGTIGPLRGLLDRKVEGHPSSGKTSSWGVGQLIKNAAQHVFDFGTNDSTAAAIKASIGRVDSKTGKKPVHVMTVNGTPAGGQSVELKNRAIRGAAHGDVRLVDWAGKHKGQLDSLGHGAYPERARLIADSIRKATGAEKKASKEQKLGKPFGGSLGKVLNKTLRSLRNNPSAKVRSGRMKQFVQRIRKAGTVPKSLTDQLNLFAIAADIADTNAGRADQLNVDNEDGTTTLMPFLGKDQGGWLNERLGHLLSYRNKIIDAINLVQERREKLRKLLDEARDRLERVKKVIKQVGREQDKRRKDLDVLRKKPKENKEKIAALRKVIMRVEGEQKDRGQVRTGLEQVIPVVRGQVTTLGGEEGLGGFQTTLAELQGQGGSMLKMKVAPPINQIGGSIFDVLIDLQDLATKASATGTDTPTDDGRADLLAELLRQANLRTAVSERQFQVLRNFDATSGAPFMGAFAKGGVALVGEKGPELAHFPSGTRVHSAADTASMVSPNVAVHIYEGEGRADVFIDDRKIDAAVQRVTRRQARQAGRGLPGRGGGV